MIEPMVWETFEWRTGADRYRFEIERGGLFATLSTTGDRKFTLPLVAWEGLLEALRTNRKARARSEQPQPLRYGARWCGAETQELKDGFANGRNVAELADAHGRTTAAIELQLSKVGLIDRAGAPTQPGPSGLRNDGPWPPELEDPAGSSPP